MPDWFKEGGFPMWFILAFGGIAVATAFVFAIRPQKEREGFIVAMSTATLFSVLSGTLAGFSAVAHHLAKHEEYGPFEFARIMTMGLGEITRPGILGFSMLSLVWLMVAVGRRRLEALGTG